MKCDVTGKSVEGYDSVQFSSVQFIDIIMGLSLNWLLNKKIQERSQTTYQTFQNVGGPEQYTEWQLSIDPCTNCHFIGAWFLIEPERTRAMSPSRRTPLRKSNDSKVNVKKTDIRPT